MRTFGHGVAVGLMVSLGIVMLGGLQTQHALVEQRKSFELGRNLSEQNHAFEKPLRDGPPDPASIADPRSIIIPDPMEIRDPRPPIPDPAMPAAR